MVKKQKSFADKAAGSKEIDAVYVKYVKSVRSEKNRTMALQRTNGSHQKK